MRTKDFIDILEKSVDITEEDFPFILHSGRGILKLTDLEMAERFSASIPTVRNWIAGKGCPAQGYRNQIVFDMVRLMIECDEEESWIQEQNSGYYPSGQDG